jgi:hypothetical protein
MGDAEMYHGDGKMLKVGKTDYSHVIVDDKGFVVAVFDSKEAADKDAADRNKRAAEFKVAARYTTEEIDEVVWTTEGGNPFQYPFQTP